MPPRINILTVASIGIFAFGLEPIVHEVLGHAIVCWLTGGILILIFHRDADCVCLAPRPRRRPARQHHLGLAAPRASPIAHTATRKLLRTHSRPRTRNGRRARRLRPRSHHTHPPLPLLLRLRQPLPRLRLHSLLRPHHPATSPRAHQKPSAPPGSIASHS